MKCIHCEAEIESDDNFCWKCGEWTSKGYTFLKDKSNVDMILNGSAIKQSDRFSILVSLLCLGIFGLMGMCYFRGQDLFKPVAYLKKQITSYIYGYNTSIIKTDNKYNRKNVNSYEDAIELIKRDFQEQSYMCYSNPELSMLEYTLEDDYTIPSVVFCDISLTEAQKIKDVVDKMYALFPNIKGALTNITITNAATNSEYIARFQPMYQFVNINDDIANYNKVNKTQILLNSYYFLNENMLEKPISDIVGENWYVNDATWESTVAHEIGHYISFVIFLREHNLQNITFVDKSNYELINTLMKEFDSGEFSKNILNEALTNYNQKYHTNFDLFSYAATISDYASTKDDKGNLIADETIAEAIHDYYLHGYSMKSSSYEIINIIKRKLG